jgi:hypothetical protein
MHIAHGLDRCVAHRRFDGLGRFFDLRVAANLLRQKVASMRDADAETLLAGIRADALGAAASREHRNVRREHPLCAAGHHERDAGLNLARSELEMRRECVAQGGDGVFASEVVDPAIAFGLAQHCENGRGVERAAVDERHEAGHVSGPVGRNANHIE